MQLQDTVEYASASPASRGALEDAYANMSPEGQALLAKKLTPFSHVETDPEMRLTHSREFTTMGAEDRDKALKEFTALGTPEEKSAYAGKYTYERPNWASRLGLNVLDTAKSVGGALDSAGKSLDSFVQSTRPAPEVLAANAAQEQERGFYGNLGEAAGQVAKSTAAMLPYTAMPGIATGMVAKLGLAKNSIAVPALTGILSEAWHKLAQSTSLEGGNVEDIGWQDVVTTALPLASTAFEKGLVRLLKNNPAKMAKDFEEVKASAKTSAASLGESATRLEGAPLPTEAPPAPLAEPTVSLSPADRLRLRNTSALSGVETPLAEKPRVSIPAVANEIEKPRVSLPATAKLVKAPSVPEVAPTTQGVVEVAPAPEVAPTALPGAQFYTKEADDALRQDWVNAFVGLPSPIAKIVKKQIKNHDALMRPQVAASILKSHLKDATPEEINDLVANYASMAKAYSTERKALHALPRPGDAPVLPETPPVEPKLRISIPATARAVQAPVNPFTPPEQAMPVPPPVPPQAAEVSTTPKVSLSPEGQRANIVGKLKQLSESSGKTLEDKTLFQGPEIAKQVNDLLAANPEGLTPAELAGLRKQITPLSTLEVTGVPVTSTKVETEIQKVLPQLQKSTALRFAGGDVLNAGRVSVAAAKDLINKLATSSTGRKVLKQLEQGGLSDPQKIALITGALNMAQ